MDDHLTTKKCPSCQEKVSFSATKCPYCGKNFKDWFIRHAVLLIIIAIFVQITIFNSIFSSQKKPSLSPEKSAQINEIGQNKNAEVNKKQLEEERLRLKEKTTELATQYCSNRKQSSRYYPIPEVLVGSDGKTEYKQNDELKKNGASLTQVDCENVIGYLNDLSLKYPLVTINIQDVIERKYWIGMNIAELSYSMGYPNKINTTNYGSGENQQWIYYKDSYGINAYYIYVENSKVTSYQDF